MVLSINYDPTRTTILRRSFAGEIAERCMRIAEAVRVRIVDEDAFGLLPESEVAVANARLLEPFREGLRRGSLTHPGHPLSCQCGCRGTNFFLNGRAEWSFGSDEQKMAAFGRWLTDQVNKDLLERDVLQQPWAKPYVEKAYRKGAKRAFTDSRRHERARRSHDFFEGAEDQFIRTLDNKRLATLGILVSRAYNEIEGVSKTMSTQITRILSTGFLRGDNPRKIAKDMKESIRKLSAREAERIARTEIIHAHAEGQLDSFEELGMEVGVLAEIKTAGDSDVCGECSALEGRTYTVDEARGMIPVHPNCSCAWIPSLEVKARRRRKRITRRRKQ